MAPPRQKLKKIYKVTPSKNVVEVAGFETEREAAEAAGGVKCWIVTGWSDEKVYPAVRHYNGREFTYYFTTPDGENHFSRWREADLPTFKEAKDFALKKASERVKEARKALADRIEKRNAIRSLRAPKKAK